jgi:hypothetical protein
MTCVVKVVFLSAVVATATGIVPIQAAAPPAPNDSAAYPPIRTAREEARLLAAINRPPQPPASPAGPQQWQTIALDQIEAAIRLANGRDPESLRRPVITADLARLHADLCRSTGRVLSASEVQAMTDYAHALLREAPHKSLRVKLAQSPPAGRPGFHGVVAELTEARVRGMILSRNQPSPTFDLTEDRARPRSTQMKIYKDEPAAFRDMLRDLAAAPEAGRRGITTHRALTWPEADGRVRRRVIDGTNYYVTTGRPRAILMPAKAFATAAESRAYEEMGRQSLRNLTARSTQVSARPVDRATVTAIGKGAILIIGAAPDVYEDVRRLNDPDARSIASTVDLLHHGQELFEGSRLLVRGLHGVGRLPGRLPAGSQLAAVSRWGGRLPWAVAVIEAVQIAKWRLGYTTDRQFARNQAQLWAGLAGGVGGGWAGLKAGALTGGAVGSLFGPTGTVAGAAVGGTIGLIGGGATAGYLAAGAAASGVEALFEFRDRDQERRYVEFVRRHYGLD